MSNTRTITNAPLDWGYRALGGRTSLRAHSSSNRPDQPGGCRPSNRNRGEIGSWRLWLVPLVGERELVLVREAVERVAELLIELEEFWSVDRTELTRLLRDARSYASRYQKVVAPGETIRNPGSIPSIQVTGAAHASRRRTGRANEPPATTSRTTSSRPRTSASTYARVEMTIVNLIT